MNCNDFVNTPNFNESSVTEDKEMSVLDTFIREDKKPIPFVILLYLGILLEPVNPKFAWFKFSISLNSFPPAVSKISTDFMFLWISEEFGSVLPKNLKNSMPLNDNSYAFSSEFIHNFNRSLVF